MEKLKEILEKISEKGWKIIFQGDEYDGKEFIDLLMECPCDKKELDYLAVIREDINSSWKCISVYNQKGRSYIYMIVC